MKYLVYILTLLPLVWIIPELGSSFDLYDDLLGDTGRWMMIWFIVLLTLGPLMRSRIVRVNTAWARQPLGLAVTTWSILHVATYLYFHAQPLELAIAEILIKPFLVLGLIAFLIILALGLTSNTWSIRRLRKKWNVLHKLALWAGAFGAAHGLVAQKVAINEFGLYSLLILLLLSWRGINALNK